MCLCLWSTGAKTCVEVESGLAGGAPVVEYSDLVAWVELYGRLPMRKNIRQKKIRAGDAYEEAFAKKLSPLRKAACLSYLWMPRPC